MKLLSKNLKLKKEQFGLNLGTGSNNQFPELSKFYKSMFGTWRTLNVQGMFWREMELTAGVYNFTKFLSIVNEAIESNTRVIYTVYGCPYFYAKYTTQPLGISPYGANGAALGANSGPNDPAMLANFITALLNAVLTLEGAQEWLDQGKLVLEHSNEVNWSQSANTDGRTRYRVYDMPSLFADQKALYNAAKAINPNIVITSPSLTGLDTTNAAAWWTNFSQAADEPETFFGNMMALNDGVNSFADFCDKIAFHWYGGENNYVKKKDLIEKLLFNNGLKNINHWDTESGRNTSTLNPLLDQATAVQWIVRKTFAPLLLGAEVHCEYQLGYPNFNPGQVYSLASWPLVMETMRDLINKATTIGIDDADLDVTTGALTMNINGVSTVY